MGGKKQYEKQNPPKKQKVLYSWYCFYNVAVPRGWDFEIWLI